jgi:hypothetical protein
MAELEKDTPAWLRAQISKAERDAPVGMPLGDVVVADEVKLAGEEKFRGEEEEDNSPKPKSKRKRKKKDTEYSFHSLGEELADMLDNKNRQYGDSYARMAHVLPMFYPDGVPGDRLLDAVFILRIIDKLMRIASAQGDDVEDPVKDIAGYAILRMKEMRSGD